MCCPHQPSKYDSWRQTAVEIEIPSYAESGPLALVHQPTPQALADLQCLIKRYSDDYPDEWVLSAFTIIRFDEWCYPIAFTDSPRIVVTQVPRTAAVQVFDSVGRRAEGKVFNVGDEVTLRYRVEPRGSDANAPLAVQTAGGAVSTPAAPNTLLYRVTQPGTGSVRLTWGPLTVIVRIEGV
jgi:hypothetical protein